MWLKCLKYPLTPVPLSLSHVNGTMLSTPKSVLFAYFETKGTMTTPDKIDVQIVDAAFFSSPSQGSPG